MKAANASRKSIRLAEGLHALPSAACRRDGQVGSRKRGDLQRTYYWQLLSADQGPFGRVIPTLVAICSLLPIQWSVSSGPDFQVGFRFQ